MILTCTADFQDEIVIFCHHFNFNIPCIFRLKDSVVIIDEAHNLIETINEIHSLNIKEKDCVTTHRKLAVYLRKVNIKVKKSRLR